MLTKADFFFYIYITEKLFENKTLEARLPRAQSTRLTHRSFVPRANSSASSSPAGRLHKHKRTALSFTLTACIVKREPLHESMRTVE